MFLYKGLHFSSMYNLINFIVTDEELYSIEGQESFNQQLAQEALAQI